MSGKRRLIGEPGVHLDILVDDLTLVVDDDAGVLDPLALLVQDPRIETAPDLQFFALCLDTFDGFGIPGQSDLDPVVRSHALEAALREDDHVDARETGAGPLHILDDAVCVVIDVFHRVRALRSELDQDRLEDAGAHNGVQHVGCNVADGIFDTHYNFLLYGGVISDNLIIASFSLFYTCPAVHRRRRGSCRLAFFMETRVAPILTVLF